MTIRVTSRRFHSWAVFTMLITSLDAAVTGRPLSTGFQTHCSKRVASRSVLSSSFPLLAFESGHGTDASFKRAYRRLQMSSIPDDDDCISPNSKNWFKWLDKLRDLLPPLPEDPIALSGDIVALFVYSYLDHTVTEIYSEAASMDVGDLVTAAVNPNSPPLPVWFEPSHLNEFGHWLVQSTAETSPYAPAIAASGLAFVSIASCWILCGYFSGAFLLRNTLECDTSQAMVVTGKTWVFMAILMVGLALGSDALWGQLDAIRPLSAPARGGLTKADADYIFDSLTVLAFWRFMFNSLLGYR